jgi:hypothetical protein
MSLSSFTWQVVELIRGAYNRDPLLPRKAHPLLQASF